MRKIRLIQITVLCCCMGYFSFRGNVAAVIMTSTDDGFLEAMNATAQDVWGDENV